jgi:hypothetical protein
LAWRRKIIEIRATAVVDKHRSSSCLHIEVVIVVAGDGEVPHPADLVFGGVATVGDSDGAVSGFEVLALPQLARADPLVQWRVPEQVVAGGVDDLGPGAGLDGEVS